MAHHYLACDLGAESGRLMLGTLDGEKLHLEELHRFPNHVQRIGDSLRWNIPELFSQLKVGLRKAGERKLPIESISTDSWGVDYVLLDASGKIMEPVFHYRDPRSAQGVNLAHSRVSWETIFEETGIQFMQINTLYQLASEDPARLRSADQVLSIADVFNYMLGGRPAVEVSNASTFQLYNPRQRAWAWGLIEKLGFPKGLFREIVAPGTPLGRLRSDLAAESGLPLLQVISTCSHDTGAAVVGVPAASDQKGHWAYLSSGTWSLMGVEMPEPIITGKARELNFTNEIGYNQTVRLLKNIIGLWLVQECRRAWKEEGTEMDYGELTRQAADAQPFRSLINPAAPEFLTPGNMPGKIAAFCSRSGQPSPGRPAEFIRCILESLVLLYRHTFKQLEELLGSSISELYIVGGGSKNELLNQFTADVLGIRVSAGPVEATAAGNILIQAMALGHVRDLPHARSIIRNSSDQRIYLPNADADWRSARERFERLLHG